eukprot:5652536-Prymnesium_polylepis.2
MSLGRMGVRMVDRKHGMTFFKPREQYSTWTSRLVAAVVPKPYALHGPTTLCRRLRRHRLRRVR